MKKFVLSYSCGKDSTLALYRLIKRGLKPACLIITINKDENESWFHKIPDEILDEISNSLDIPLIKVVCKGEEYENLFEEALKKAKTLGAEICAFGDIDIDEHRKWCTDRCKNCLIDAEFPLWQEDRESLTYEFIDAGFKALIKCCNNVELDDTYLGKNLTREMVSKIKNTGADPCGENGEYHTFVYGGPIFKNKINFKLGERFRVNNYNHIRIEK